MAWCCFRTIPPAAHTSTSEDAQRNAGLGLVRVFDQGSRWRLDNGIGLGTPLSDILRRNGSSRSASSGWIGITAANITDWGGGRLDPKDDPSGAA